MSTLGSGPLNNLISRIRKPSSPRSQQSPTQSPSDPTLSTLSSLSQLKPSRRAINDFYIKLDYPHRRYKPGELITGSIVLTTSRATRITHLTLTLGGSVMVYPHNRRGHKWGEDIVKDVTYRDSKMIRGSRSRGTTIEGRHGGRGVVLFEQEQVIVGEGRLGAGGLEVGFVIEFPKKGGINSLDFERGAITYLLTATLTRPTTIHAVSTCNAEVKFSENIDVAIFSPPHPLIISIEPLKPLRRLKSSGSSNDSTTYIQTLHQPPNPSPPLSPSIPKSLSNNTPSVPPSPTGSATINPIATIELLRPACLPGESIPLRISVSHTRPLKSMSGIIISLTRQCRMDTLPPADKVLTASSLSFSKSSISTFKKSLNQTVAALIVDPRTLTSVVKTSIRVPSDAFPTITRVPQGLLEFSYMVEVIVDLGGKLSRNGVGDVIMDGSTNEDLRRVQTNDFMETDRIRREKGVISCQFEVVVGTVDSGKRRKRKDRDTSAPAAPPSAPSQASTADSREDDSTDRYVERDQAVNQVRDFLDVPEYQNSSTRSSPSNSSNTPPPMQPPPMVPPSLPLVHDEKALARIAEEQLLPSAPPLAESTAEASAPPLPYDEEDLYYLPESSAHGAAAPAYERPDSATPRSVAAHQEDKEEMERQRLLAQASAPPMPSSSIPPPSAPDVSQEDQHGSELPRYSG